MKKILFIAHDPGGYEAILPVTNKIRQESIPYEFYCIGPAAKLNPKYGVSRQELLFIIHNKIDENKISLIVTGTSWGEKIEPEIIRLCRVAGIKTMAILDYWLNYAKRFQTEAGAYHYPDHYLIMDDLAKEEAIADQVPEKILKIVGQPGLDKYITYRQGKVKIVKEKPRVLFLSQPLSLLYGNTLGYTEQSALADVVKISVKHKCDMQVKFHPKDKLSFIDKYRDIMTEGILMDIMPNYDLVIGMSTMGLLQAALMNIPIISYQPNLKNLDMCITNKLGLSDLVVNFQELNKNFFQLSNLLNVKNNFAKYIWQDGNSTQRVVSFIKENIENEENCTR